MKHNWDNYTSLEEDVCKRCGLRKRTKAQLRDIRGLLNAPFTQYFVNGQWKHVNELPTTIKKCEPITI